MVQYFNGDVAKTSLEPDEPLLNVTWQEPDVIEMTMSFETTYIIYDVRRPVHLPR